MELDIAKEIKRICDKHNINYFLAYGTLLGAVRHKGFIPWDDDMDIGMLREDYEKFLKIADKELDSQYVLKHWFNDETYHLCFAKVMKKGTLALESASKRASEQGIYVDVLPYDNVIVSNQKQKKFIYVVARMLLIKCKVYPWLEKKGINIKKYIMYLPIRLFVVFFSRNFLIKKFDKMMRQYNFLNTEYVCSFGDYYRKSFKRMWLNEFMDLSFENLMFKSLKNYDEYLKIAYGNNYMQLPPKMERTGHSIVDIKF
ncbi:MAG: LicD family protein [Lactobacillales bacterium]|nr:LicD family protein [Lactobacillales bacterium]